MAPTLSLTVSEGQDWPPSSCTHVVRSPRNCSAIFQAFLASKEESRKHIFLWHRCFLNPGIWLQVTMMPNVGSGPPSFCPGLLAAHYQDGDRTSAEAREPHSHPGRSHATHPAQTLGNGFRSCLMPAPPSPFPGAKSRPPVPARPSRAMRGRKSNVSGFTPHRWARVILQQQSRVLWGQAN